MKTPKLDLHGVFHDDVQSVVDKFLEANLYTPQLEIVTGYSTRMKSLVREILSEYNLEAKEGKFNDGTLIIKVIWKEK